MQQKLIFYGTLHCFGFITYRLGMYIDAAIDIQVHKNNFRNMQSVYKNSIICYCLYSSRKCNLC